MIMNLYDRIKFLREEQGLTQQDLAEKVGFKTASAINKIEMGLRDINQSKIILFAKALHTTPSYLMGWDDDNLSKPAEEDDLVTMPIIGDLAAGYDRIALEYWTGDIINIPKSYIKGRKKEDYIMLRVKGDSMYPLYQDGDMVLILRQETQPRAGQVCAVLYNDELSTLKKVNWGFGGVTLEPINPMYQPIEISGEDLAHFRVIGVPKLLIREIEE